jgi:hypothetical protein
MDAPKVLRVWAWTVRQVTGTMLSSVDGRQSQACMLSHSWASDLKGSASLCATAIGGAAKTERSLKIGAWLTLFT